MSFKGIDIQSVTAIAIDAGKTIMKIYWQDSFEQHLKSDRSPLTAADMAAHRLIVDRLQQLTPEIPILSEESKDKSWNLRKQWHTYWLVDPLDGTKEFIKRNGEFTVNIALIDNHHPILGVVHAPYLLETWVGEQGQPAKKITQSGEKDICVTQLQPKQTCIVVGSRSHAGDALQLFLDNLGLYELISVGSSLKLCMVAEGKAHLYPRLGLTSEWDTAAAHAVVNAAGGEVIDVETKLPLLYNTKESLLNPFFMVRVKSFSSRT